MTFLMQLKRTSLKKFFVAQLTFERVTLLLSMLTFMINQMAKGCKT